jgi:AcrR family transcriptional regulator
MIVMPIRDRAAERRDSTRAEILEHAWAIARERSLSELTLREIAQRMGMRPPSLYTHFASKNAVIDGMFGQAWLEYLGTVQAARPRLPADPRARLQALARNFFDFAVVDPARFQLMNQRVVADFAPSAESYAPAVEVLALLAGDLADAGLPGQDERDLFVAIVGGLADAQLANGPGGDRWGRLLPRAIDMYADAVGLPRPRPRSRRNP